MSVISIIIRDIYANYVGYFNFTVSDSVIAILEPHKYNYRHKISKTLNRVPSIKRSFIRYFELPLADMGDNAERKIIVSIFILID